MARGFWRANFKIWFLVFWAFKLLANFGARILGVNFKNRANFWCVSLRQILKSGVMFAPSFCAQNLK
ncbi:MAG: hypothetical protein CGEMS_1530 [Candidatus Campylobacter infans]|nr:MAG: hypothetical protein CGEMS_1530 [Candidatus Campylobacter infans]